MKVGEGLKTKLKDTNTGNERASFETPESLGHVSASSREHFMIDDDDDSQSLFGLQKVL